ncbi:MAG: M56 family metallopeptidase [Ferruginibacter sp.]|nr:M56 family metallopeptidase [Ferruginibacter sp.]
MQLTVFDHAYLLQSIGWAIINSFWQTGGLWLLYQFIIVTDKKLPALVKHHLSIIFLVTSFIWFVVTLVQNYWLFKNDALSTGITFFGWMTRFQFFHHALPFISIVYLVLLCFYIAQFAKNLSCNQFLQSQGLIKPPIDYRLFVSNTALHLGIKRKIQVWLSNHVEVPSVIGWIKPVILLPLAMVSQLTIRQTEAILLHELAHIRRNDYLVNILQSVLALTLFFNPFAILLNKAAKKERENSCDDWVLNFRYDQSEYAGALIVLEEQRHIYQSGLAVTATNGKKNLLLRIKRLFNVSPQTYFNTSHKIKVISLCFLSFTGIFTLMPSIIKKTAGINEKLMVSNNKETAILVKFDKLPADKIPKNSFSSMPKQDLFEKKQVAIKNTLKRRPITEQTKDYVNAFINEELLDPPTRAEAVVMSVVDNEITNSTYIVKIEEEQSGKKQKNTYYFEINNKEGKAVIKPLIILNKLISPAKSTGSGNLTDSSGNSRKLFTKKRTTS